MQFVADLDRLREAREWAANAARDYGFDEPDCYQVKLAMSEVVANAIQHGSVSTADVIEVLVFEAGDALVFEVIDTGAFRAAPEVLDEFAERGRGLDLVALLMDEVAMEPGSAGTRLRFSKRLAA